MTHLVAQAPAVRPPIPGAPASVTAFVDVAVISMDAERVLAGQTVVVQHGRITALGPASQMKVPAGATRIDGRGKYLIPGLSDCHAHIGWSARDSVESEHRLLLYALNGVTTIRNMDYLHKGVDGPTLLRLRARAAAGELLSPRIYTSGPWAPLQYIGTYKDAPKPSLDSIEAYVRAYKADGYDFIKIHDKSGVVVESLAVVARRVGVPIAGHARRKQGIEWTLALGAYTSFEHLVAYDRDTAYKMRDTADAIGIRALALATQRAGVWNCPTMVLKAQNTSEAPLRRRFVKALHDAGAGLLLGTDAPAGPATFGLGVHQELEELVRAGLTPYQALETGTRNAAAYFGTLAETGTIAVGKRADLVLLRGNPLADIRNTAPPTGVMLGGRWLALAAVERDTGVVERVWERALAGLDLRNLLMANIQQQSFRQVVGPFDLQRRALRNSLMAGAALGRSDSVTNHQRAVRLLAGHLGELRGVLSADQKKLFDPKARAWLQEQRANGVPVTIPGVQ